MDMSGLLLKNKAQYEQVMVEIQKRNIANCRQAFLIILTEGDAASVWFDGYWNLEYFPKETVIKAEQRNSSLTIK